MFQKKKKFPVNCLPFFLFFCLKFSSSRSLLASFHFHVSVTLRLTIGSLPLCRVSLSNLLFHPPHSTVRQWGNIFSFVGVRKNNRRRPRWQCYCVQTKSNVGWKKRKANNNNNNNKEGGGREKHQKASSTFHHPVTKIVTIIWDADHRRPRYGVIGKHPTSLPLFLWNLIWWF